MDIRNHKETLECSLGHVGTMEWHPTQIWPQLGSNIRKRHQWQNKTDILYQTRTTGLYQHQTNETLPRTPPRPTTIHQMTMAGVLWGSPPQKTTTWIQSDDSWTEAHGDMGDIKPNKARTSSNLPTMPTHTMTISNLGRKKKVHYYKTQDTYIPNEDSSHNAKKPTSFYPMVQPNWKWNDIKPLRDRSNL